MTLGVARRRALGVAASFVPTNISGLALWLDPTDITTLWKNNPPTTPVTADADVVQVWQDKSGNAHTFVNSTTPPHYKTAIQNGKAIIRFVTGNTMACTAFNLSNFSIFMVAKRASGGDYGLLGGTSSATQWRLGQNSVNKLSTFDGSNNPQSSTLGTDTTTTFTVLEFLRTTSTVSFFQGGTAAGTGTMSGTRPVQQLASLVGGNAFNGDIGEVIIYDSALSAGNQAAVEGYLKTKWGTP